MLVIAETTDFPVKFRKIVVTDDLGRYLIPELPSANYKVWVRGYSLVDSKPVLTKPGKTLALTAVIAPNARAAAQYYPANYWYSLLRVPPKEAFPMTVDVPGPVGGGPAVGLQVIDSQDTWIDDLKGCVICHQMGDKATREIPPGLGAFDSTIEAWDQMLKIGGNAGGANLVNQMGHKQMVGFYADWTDRINKGEVPPAPPRPAGIERNLVLSIWDAGSPTTFMHDVISTDKRDPKLNANGAIFGIDYHNGTIVIMDPVNNTNQVISLPTLVDKKNMLANQNGRVEPSDAVKSPYWTPQEFDPIDDATNPNSLTMDELGRVWMTSNVRASENPDICKEGSANKFALAYPIPHTDRHLSMYDPKTKTFKLAGTCFRAHHVNFGYDKDRTLYSDGGSPNGTYGVIGWLNTKMFERTGDAMASQGWCSPYFDMNGDGKFDPQVDRRVPGNPYSVQPSPSDGSVWVAYASYPGKIVRMDRGNNPPATCKFEVYEPPYDNPARPGEGLTGRVALTSIRTELCGQRSQAAANSPASIGQSAKSALVLRVQDSNAPRDGRCIQFPVRISKALPSKHPRSGRITTGWINSIRSAWGTTFQLPTAQTPIRCWYSIPNPGNGRRCVCRTRCLFISAVLMDASTIQTPDGKGADSGPTTAPELPGIRRAARES